MRGRSTVAFLAVAAALAACGTTVPLTSTGPGSANGSLGVGDPGGSTSSGTTTGAGTTGEGSTSTTGGSNVPGGVTGPIPTGGPSSPQPGVPQTTGAQPLPTGGKGGPAGTALGVTATTIKIGVFTAQGFGDFAASAGFSAGTGDQRKEAQATIDHINAHGGLAGRKIIPVFHDISVAGAAANVDSEYTAACAAWTEDDRVYAVVSFVGTVDNVLYECLSKRGVPVMASGDSQDASFFEKYANYYYQPADMNLRRIMGNLADGLFTAGFFGPKPKIAVLRVDSANEKAAVDKGLVPALARHGLKLADQFAVPGGTDTSGYQAAVLRFKTEGITHVLFTYQGSPLLFMVNAENQKYYPRYGIHSRNSPATLLQGSAPAKQQHGTMGIGWQPMNDVDSSNDPGVLNGRQKLCLKLLNDSGQAGQGRIAALLALWMCDNFLFLQDALAKAPSFTMAGLRTGAESLGTFPSASTFRSTIAPGRLHDGAGQYRLIAFKDDCTCYQYVSPLKTAF
jgi:ABC-type branched-subunit amino acid transport system substrate-binding protein